MAMSKRRNEQKELFVTHQQMRGPSHPYYKTVNKVLDEYDFDKFVEKRCKKFYATKMGRPSIAPGVYFRCLLLGYFEGIDSERGIAWRAADSLSIREFLGIEVGKQTPEHSTLSKTRTRLDLQTHHEVFTWILGVLADKALVKGKTVGVDGTTLEANAAMKSIVRRDDGRKYQEFLADLAKASGLETPTREDLARLDRKRKGKKTSNDDWYNPNDPDAHVTKMKDGRTHMGHKQEHAVDMDTGAIVAVTVTGGTEGDTKTLGQTVEKTATNLGEAEEQTTKNGLKKLAGVLEEVVADKGYHSNETVGWMNAAGVRSYFAEPDRGRRKWRNDGFSQQAVYANRRRNRSTKGRRLMRRRGELIERSFAHMLDTGGMRRTHLRGHENILKRVMVHAAAFNIGLVMRSMLGFGKPRCFQGRAAALRRQFFMLWRVVLDIRRFARPWTGLLSHSAGAFRWFSPTRLIA